MPLVRVSIVFILLRFAKRENLREVLEAGPGRAEEIDIDDVIGVEDGRACRDRKGIRSRQLP